MARIDPDEQLAMPVLDRLLDDDPSSSRDARLSRGASVRALRDAVRRDLENLLNTRQRCVGWPDDLTELEVSIINYGIPDFAAIALSSEDGREEFRDAVERTIRRFEPRFKSVSVKLLDNAEPLDRTLRFRVDALIHADPAPEPIVFDSVVDSATRTFSVVSRDDA